MDDKKDIGDNLQRVIEEERQRTKNAEAIAAQVKQDMAALISEFSEATGEESLAAIRKNIRGRIPAALTVLDHLMLNGSDNIKSTIAKYYIDRGLEESIDDLGNEAAKLNKLLEGLKVD